MIALLVLIAIGAGAFSWWYFVFYQYMTHNVPYLERVFEQPDFKLYLIGAIALAVLVAPVHLVPKDIQYRKDVLKIGWWNALLCIAGPALIWVGVHAGPAFESFADYVGFFLMIPLAIIAAALFFAAILPGIGFLIAMFAYPFLMAFGIVIVIPYAFLGLYTASISSRTVDVAKKHANTKRPSDVIERQLAEAIESGLSSDAQIKALVEELPASARARHLLVYKQKTEKYRKIRELLEAQERAIREKQKLAEAAHELERTKRGVHD